MRHHVGQDPARQLSVHENFICGTGLVHPEAVWVGNSGEGAALDVPPHCPGI